MTHYGPSGSEQFRAKKREPVTAAQRLAQRQHDREMRMQQARPTRPGARPGPAGSMIDQGVPKKAAPKPKDRKS